MPEEKKDTIMWVLRKYPSKKYSITELNRIIDDISYPTLLKWVAVLEAEKKIKIDDHGNVKLVYLNPEYFKNGEKK